ncbi:DUF397 domain-containing protein [Streptomyces cavernae]|uniref:DUF397 domain-containing protein n=1 Tax=Streptomyces cavernae TaxID=2259034 RepID=UPI000FEBD80C|nr:DUF397 domain-containing protein [Streptomyces cavernae]
METSEHLTSVVWRRSSYSGTSGGDCVEVAHLPAHIALRDSKNPEVGTFVVSPTAFGAFVAAAAQGVL